MCSRKNISHIFEISLSYWNSQVLMSAVSMGVFEKLSSNQKMNLVELCDSFSCDVRVGKDFFDTLVSLDLLEINDKYYCNSQNANSYLVPGKDGYVGGWITLTEKRLLKSWSGLSQTIIEGKPQNESKHVDDYYDYISNDSELLCTFADGMDGLSSPVIETIVEKISWPKFNSFADIGGGRGTLAFSIAEKYQHMFGVVFDKHEFKDLFIRNLATRKKSSNVSFFGGDFFKDSIPKADILIFGFILHNWSIEHKKYLLDKAYGCLPDGGLLIIYESLIDNERSDKTLALEMSINMALVTKSGIGLTIKQMKKLLFNSGYETKEIYNVSKLHDVVIAQKG